MVKKIDDNFQLEHIGWALWQAAQAWKQRFDHAMIEAGHTWFSEARSAVLAHLDIDGTRQTTLTARMGISKQAVQQLVSELESEDIIYRHTDATDSRVKIIQYTEKGLSLLRESNEIKKQIEREYRLILGDNVFDIIKASLQKLKDAAPHPP